MTYVHVKVTVATSNDLRGDDLQENTLFDVDLEVKVTQHIAQNPLYLLTHARVKFQVKTSKGFEGNAFARKFNIS